MADSALQCLQRSTDDLASAVTMLTHTHGKVLVVARLCNGLEQLRFDVADAQDLRPPGTPVGQPARPQTMHTVTDEPYDRSMCGDDDDQVWRLPREEPLSCYDTPGRLQSVSSRS